MACGLLVVQAGEVRAAAVVLSVLYGALGWPMVVVAEFGGRAPLARLLLKRHFYAMMRCRLGEA